MADQQVKVTQIDALHEFRAALVEYVAALRDTSELLMHEGRRGSSWVEDDRSSYWPAEVRRQEDNLVAAKALLEQCMARQMGEQKRSCIDEKKAVNAVKSKLDNARDKVRLAQSWKGKVAQEGDEFETRIVQLLDYADIELPKAVVVLDRMIIALEKYVRTTDGPPPPAPGATGPSTGPKKQGK